MALFNSSKRTDMVHVPCKGGAPEVLRDYLAAEIARWGKVIAEVGVMPE